MCVWSRVILLVCGPDWSSSEVVGNMGGNSFFFFFYIILYYSPIRLKPKNGKVKKRCEN